MSWISGPLKFWHSGRHRCTHQGSCGARERRRRGRPLAAALVQQGDERLDALFAAQLLQSAITWPTSVRKSSPSTALGVTTVGVSWNVRPMKAIFAPPMVCTSYGGRIVSSVFS